MKHGWGHRAFEKCLEKVVYTTKLQSSNYQEKGKYPIVSQEDCLISGYWDNDEDVFRLVKPIVVFGDHTRILKYIDFDFVLGADGVKILQPTDDIKAKFLYYYLKWYNVPSLGYSRHYKLLKECLVPIPSIHIQEQICSLLDKLNFVIEKKKEQVAELDKLVQSLFYDMFGDPFTNEKGWDVKTIKDSCKRLYAGGDVPRDRFCKEKNTDYTIPIFSNGTENNGLYGYTDEPRETENCITIAGRGTIGYCVIRREPFFPIIRLIVAVPKDEINVVYLKGVIDCLKLKGQGVAIPQLTIPMIKDNIIPVPPLPLQQAFAEKVKAIEQQKELINQSIKDVQTLFDAKMDYYFGD